MLASWNIHMLIQTSEKEIDLCGDNGNNKLFQCDGGAPAVFPHTGQIHEVFKSFVKALPALELSGQIHNLDQPRD